MNNFAPGKVFCSRDFVALETQAPYLHSQSDPVTENRRAGCHHQLHMTWSKHFQTCPNSKYTNYILAKRLGLRPPMTVAGFMKLWTLNPSVLPICQSHDGDFSLDCCTTGNRHKSCLRLGICCNSTSQEICRKAVLHFPWTFWGREIGSQHLLWSATTQGTQSVTYSVNVKV